MEHVGATIAFEMRRYVIGELINYSNQSLFGQVEVAGWHMDDAMVRLNLHFAGQVGTPCPGVGRALHARVGQR